MIKICILIILSASITHLHSQTYTLQQIIDATLYNNSSIKTIKLKAQLATLQYNNFLLQRKPSLVLNGNVPVYDKDNFSVRQPDGSIKFLTHKQINSNVNIGFVQPITATGGNVSVNTSLNRFDELVGKTKTYSGTPIYIQMQQPLFVFNNLKWQKKLEPLRLQTTTIENKALLEAEKYKVVNLFFTILQTQIEDSLLQLSQTLNEWLIAAENKKKQLGLWDNEKLLQLQETTLQLQLQKNNNQVSYQTTMLQLQHIAPTIPSNLVALLPNNYPTINLSATNIIDSVTTNNINWHKNKIAVLELQSEKERLQKEKTTINLLLNYGLNQSGNALHNVYTNANDQQRFNISFNVPLYDWGKRKNNATIVALKQLQNAEQIKITESETLTEIKTILLQLQQIISNATTSKAIDNILQQRLALTQKLYENGKLTFLELQTAINTYIQTKRNDFLQLKEYYLLYYKMQQICSCSL